MQYRDISLIVPLGPYMYIRPMPRAVWWSWGGVPSHARGNCVAGASCFVLGVSIFIGPLGPLGSSSSHHRRTLYHTQRLSPVAQVLATSGGKGRLMNCKHVHYTPTREIRQHVRALARNRPEGRYCPMTRATSGPVGNRAVHARKYVTYVT